MGRTTAKRLPNNVTSYYNYDQASQVASILHAGPGGLLQSLYYTYDPDSRRTKIVREDGTGIYYNYDAAGRLTDEDWLNSAGSGLYAFDYSFDAAGNRTQMTKDGVTTYYEYNNLNQLTAEKKTTGELTYYTYQQDGALATKHEAAGWSYFTWDVDESLTQVATPATQLENAYDAEMKRVRRTEGNQATYFAFDGEKLVLSAAPGGVTQFLSEGPSIYSPLLSHHGSDFFYLFDALGTTLGLTDSSGLLTDTFLYDAFGNALNRTGSTVTPYQYVGAFGYFDEAEIGMMNLRRRWYDPRVGRPASSGTAQVLGRRPPPGLLPFPPGWHSGARNLLDALHNWLQHHGVAAVGGGGASLNAGGIGGSCGVECLYLFCDDSGACYLYAGPGVLGSAVSISAYAGVVIGIQNPQDYAGPFATLNITCTPLTINLSYVPGKAGIYAVTVGPGVGLGVSGNYTYYFLVFPFNVSPVGEPEPPFPTWGYKWWHYYGFDQFRPQPAR